MPWRSARRICAWSKDARPKFWLACRRPDTIFVGGGATAPGVIEAALEALLPGGRLVVNGVTLETQSLLVARHAALGGNLLQAQIARAEKLGGFTAFRPALPIVQWIYAKKC